MSAILKDKKILITGATGSFGRAVIDKIASGPENAPSLIRVFSRDEAKQFQLREDLKNYGSSFGGLFEYVIGDIRDPNILYSALSDIQIVIHAAALKHVPVCEKNPGEAIAINALGAGNLVHAVTYHAKQVEKVVAISTDKACAPFSLMGMTKALQERIFISAAQKTGRSFVCVRMGNMIMSRGSVVPLFLEQIDRGGPLTITEPNMTRFFITLEQAAGHALTALEYAKAGQIYIPEMKAVSISRLVKELRGNENVEIKILGARPGEKLYDILVSKDEIPYLSPCDRGGFLLSPYPIMKPDYTQRNRFRDICSSDSVFQMSDEEIKNILQNAVPAKLELQKQYI